MAIIKISAPNPLDGTTTFDQVQHGQADDSSGTNAAVVNTASVDTSKRSPINPGTTEYVYTSGATNKYYSARYKNSSSGVTTDWMTWTLGGKDRWDTMFENEMDDTANAVVSQAGVQRFKDWALEAFYPDLFNPSVIDTSLTVDNDTSPEYQYDIPFGMFNITEVAFGDVNNLTSYFKVVDHDNWKVEGNKLHFMSLAGFTDDAAIRLVGAKKYLEVGDVPERYDRIAMHHMKMNYYLYLSEDFPRFKKWAQLQEGTKVSFENMRVQAREFERKFIEAKAEARELANSLGM